MCFNHPKLVHKHPTHLAIYIMLLSAGDPTSFSKWRSHVVASKKSRSSTVANMTKLEKFQAEIGRRLLGISRYHADLAPLIGLHLCESAQPAELNPTVCLFLFLD